MLQTLTIHTDHLSIPEINGLGKALVSLLNYASTQATATPLLRNRLRLWCLLLGILQTQAMKSATSKRINMVIPEVTSFGLNWGACYQQLLFYAHLVRQVVPYPVGHLLPKEDQQLVRNRLSTFLFGSPVPIQPTDIEQQRKNLTFEE